jgi:hypothetical protein
VNLIQRGINGEISFPDRCEGMALTRDGSTLDIASQVAPELNVIDAHGELPITGISIAGTPSGKAQLHRAHLRMTPIKD